MNNGTTGAGRREREMRRAIHGKPKGSAHMVAGHGTISPTWEYRGFRFRSRRAGGWGGGNIWTLVSWPERFKGGLGAGNRHKESLMAGIDRFWGEGHSAP